MKRGLEHKTARAILEMILRDIDNLPPDLADEYAYGILRDYVMIHPKSKFVDELYPDKDVTEYFFFPIVEEVSNTPDPGRPAPQGRQLSDLLKDPTEAAKVEEVMRQHVNTPPDLAALVEALSRLKKLTQEAANAASVVRIADGIIGAKRTGTARSLRENRARAASKDPGKEGKISRKIESFITLLTQRDTTE